jgi:uncharacterized protein (TIGR02172 family)
MEQINDPGRFIGRGNTADVYQHNEKLALKLYNEKFGSHLASYEQQVMSALNEAGAPAPQVFDIVQYGGRYGLMMELIEGQTLDKMMRAELARLGEFGGLMASLHAAMHKATTSRLQSQHRALADRISNNKPILGDLTTAVLNYLDTLPAGSNVCHGDFHPKNIMASRGKALVIDWTNAYSGHPLSDVMLTRLRLTSPYVPQNFPGDASVFLDAKKVVYDSYINNYAALTGVNIHELDDWLLPCAAAQLHPRKADHAKWLLELIAQQLKERGIKD